MPPGMFRRPQGGASCAGREVQPKFEVSARFCSQRRGAGFIAKRRQPHRHQPTSQLLAENGLVSPLSNGAVSMLKIAIR